MRLCLYVCPRTYLKNHKLLQTSPKFLCTLSFVVAWPCSGGAVMLCTPGFVDGIKFHIIDRYPKFPVGIDIILEIHWVFGFSDTPFFTSGGIKRGLAPIQTISEIGHEIIKVGITSELSKMTISVHRLKKKNFRGLI